MSVPFVRVQSNCSPRRGAPGTGRRRLAVVAVLALLAALGLAAPAQASVDGAPTGEVEAAVDDPTITTPAGETGGLRVTGWVNDPDRGDAQTQLSVSVDGAEPIAVGGPVGDSVEFEIAIPLGTGDHEVCVTAVNIGLGEDVDLGCVVGSVLAQAPVPFYAGMDAWPVELRDGVPIAPSPSPPIVAVGCLDAGEWGVEVTGWQAAFALEGADGHRVRSQAVPGDVWDDGGGLCAFFEWTLDRDLHPDVTYTVTVQTWFDGADPSAWSEGYPFIAYTTPEQRLNQDYASGDLSVDDYARYAVYRWFDAAQVPEEYRVPDGTETPDLSVQLAEVFGLLDDLNPAVASELRAFFSPDGVDHGNAVPLTAEEAQAGVDAFYAAADGESLVPAQPDTSAVATKISTPSRAAGLQSEAAADLSTLTRIAESTVPDAGGALVYADCDDENPWVVPPTLSSSLAVLPCRLVTPLATFHYTTSDRSAVHGVQADDALDLRLRGQADGRGPDSVPDEIDAIAAAYVQAFDTYRGLGYATPARADVAVGKFEAGLSLPVIDTIFVTRKETNVDSVYTMRHELFHQFQYSYVSLGSLIGDMTGKQNSTTGWWLEATAEWGAHQAEAHTWGTEAASTWFRDARQRYDRNLFAHLGDPAQALTTFHAALSGPGPQPQYGSFLFAEYLEQLYGADVILETWKAQIPHNLRAIDAIDYVLENDHATTLADVVLAYQRANETINTPEFAGNLTYADPDRSNWANVRLDATGGRPGHSTVNLLPGAMPVHGVGSIEAGGAFYLDLNDAYYTAPDYALLDPAGVTFTVAIDAVDGQVDDLVATVVYFDDYPSTCYPFDTRGLSTSPGHAEQTVTLSPSCPMATLIVSNPQAQNTYDGLFPWEIDHGEVGFTYVITARPTSTTTVTEYRGSGIIHQRVNFGADLRRSLGSADGSASFSINLGQSVSQGRRAFTLNVFSHDASARGADTVLINGTPVELDLHRAASAVDGRFSLLYGDTWGAYALSWYLLPDELLHDGLNSFVVPVNDPLYIVGAYVASSDPAT